MRQFSEKLVLLGVFGSEMPRDERERRFERWTLMSVITHPPGEDEEDFEDEYPTERWAEGNGTWVPAESL